MREEMMKFERIVFTKRLVNDGGFMRRLILGFVFMLTSVCCNWVYAQKSEAQLDKELAQVNEEFQTLARKQSNESARSVCVSRWANDSTALQSLTGVGITVGQLCKCVEQEMRILVSDDLAFRFFNWIIDSKVATDNKQPVERNVVVAMEFNKLLNAATSGCAMSLTRRR